MRSNLAILVCGKQYVVEYEQTGLVRHVVRPLLRRGWTVRVFDCTETGSDQDAEVFRVKAANALERRHECFEYVQRRVVVDYYLMTRPDAIWFGEPTFALVNEVGIRVRLFNKRDGIAYAPTETSYPPSPCVDRSCEKRCILVDDQVAFVPRNLSGPFFGIGNARNRFSCCGFPSHFQESHYTQALNDARLPLRTTSFPFYLHPNSTHPLTKRLVRDYYLGNGGGLCFNKTR